MTKTMDSEFPRLVKFIAIISIKIIRMFFNLERFSNDMRGVIRCRGKDSGLVKENKVFRIVGAFGNN
jgi:hypothetical protein